MHIIIYTLIKDTIGCYFVYFEMLTNDIIYFNLQPDFLNQHYVFDVYIS